MNDYAKNMTQKQWSDLIEQVFGGAPGRDFVIIKYYGVDEDGRHLYQVTSKTRTTVRQDLVYEEDLP